jgi:hypothetical protein
MIDNDMICLHSKHRTFLPKTIRKVSYRDMGKLVVTRCAFGVVMSTQVKKEAVAAKLYFQVGIEYIGDWGAGNTDTGYVLWPGAEAWDAMSPMARADYMLDEIHEWFHIGNVGMQNNWTIQRLNIFCPSSYWSYKVDISGTACTEIDFDSAKAMSDMVHTLEEFGMEDYEDDVMPGMELEFRLVSSGYSGIGSVHIPYRGDEHWDQLSPKERLEWMRDQAAEYGFYCANYVFDAGDCSFSNVDVILEDSTWLHESKVVAPNWEHLNFEDETYEEYLANLSQEKDDVATVGGVA